MQSIYRSYEEFSKVETEFFGKRVLFAEEKLQKPGFLNAFAVPLRLVSTDTVPAIVRLFMLPPEQVRYIVKFSIEYAHSAG